MLTLKKALLLEFGHFSSPAPIHQILSSRNCCPNEELLKIFLHMREIANRGNIDEMFLIHYVIQGINGTLQNKALLFGCSDLPTFKQKILIYDEICQSVRNTKPRTSGYSSESFLRGKME